MEEFSFLSALGPLLFTELACAYAKEPVLAVAAPFATAAAARLINFLDVRAQDREQRNKTPPQGPRQ